MPSSSVKEIAIGAILVLNVLVLLSSLSLVANVQGEMSRLRASIARLKHFAFRHESANSSRIESELSAIKVALSNLGQSESKPADVGVGMALTRTESFSPRRIEGIQEVQKQLQDLAGNEETQRHAKVDSKKEGSEEAKIEATENRATVMPTALEAKQRLVGTHDVESSGQHSNAVPVRRFQTIHRDYTPRINGTVQEIPWSKFAEAGREYVKWDRERSRDVTDWAGPTHMHAAESLSRIKTIYVWGERHSCTNLVSEVVEDAFGQFLKCGKPSCVKEGRPWKHDPMRLIVRDDEEEALHLLVTRDPYSWVESMHDFPHHAEFHHDLSLERFLAREWVGFKGWAAAAYGPRHRNAKGGAVRPQPPPAREGEWLFGNELYQCTVAPGHRLSSAADVRPSTECLAAPASRERCGSNWACRVGGSMPWEQDPDAWVGWLQRRPGAGLFQQEAAEGVRQLAAQVRASPTWPLVGDWTLGENWEERDQDSGGRYPSVLALRTAKLRDWIRVHAQLPLSAHLQCRDLILNQSAVLASLAARFQLPQPAAPEGESCYWFGGACKTGAEAAAARRQALATQHARRMSPRQFEAVNAWLDPDVEAAVGYLLHRTAAAADVPYNASSRCSHHLPPRWRAAHCGH